MMIFKTLNTEFTGIRCTGSLMIPVHWTLTADLMISEDSGKHEVGFQQMMYWISTLLDSSIIINIDDHDARELSRIVDNEVVSLPSDPADDILTHALIEKLNTIGKSKGLAVVGISLESDNITCHIKEYDSSKCILPDISYAGVKATKKLKQPWWKRSTSETSDVMDDDQNTILIQNPESDVLNRFGTEIEKRLYPSEILEEPKIAKVIEPEWKKTK